MPAFAVSRPGGHQFWWAVIPVMVFGMQVIRMPASYDDYPEHDHAEDRQEEVYFVLEGELTLGVEGVEHVLGEDQLVRVGPGVRRQLVNRGSERLVLLALGGAGEHVGRDGHAWSTWEETGPGKPPQEIPLPDDLLV